MAVRILILGGTTEAGLLARRLAGDRRFDATLSLAGRTATPAAQALPTRIGGFGGVEGLEAYLRAEGVRAVVDATHPFAARISANAAAACRQAGVPLVAFSRPPWRRVAGDRWTEVDDNAAAVAALGPAPRRVLLTIGRLGIGDFRGAAQHHYVVRTIDAPEAADLPPSHELLLDRGPFDVVGETALLRGRDIDVVVTKNAGGAATYAKIEAARGLGLPVILVTPPARPDVPLFDRIEDVMAFLDGVAGGQAP
jgi:precorrin-6A/cobalt-precorrin-6A reductase